MELKIDRHLINQLDQEWRILYMINHRNKNQHKSTIWWKHLNVLKRNVIQVLTLLKLKSIKEENYRQLYRLITKFQIKQVKKIYYSFNGIIALGQFITLGVILIGLLARIYVIYSDIMSLCKEKFKDLRLYPQLETQNHQLLTFIDEELGEELNEKLDNKIHDSVLSFIQETYEKPRMKEKSFKKKKRVKSAIDDIFG